MKRQYKFLTAMLFIATAMLAAGCEKQVDLSPTDSINEENAFQTVDDLEKGLLAAYGAWPGESVMYLNALITDEVKISNENRGQGQFTFKWQYNPSEAEVTGEWDGWYIIIGRINKELDQFDKVVPRNPTEATLKEKVKGELLAIRAIAHLQLMQHYAGYYSADALGVPYTTTSDIGARPAREKMSDVLTKILADLQAGKDGPLPTAPTATGTSGTIRLSKSAIAGFQARASLYKRDYTNAATFATEAIQLSGKVLSPAATFPGIWTDGNETEIMLRLRRTGTSVGTLWQDTNGDVFFEPSDKLKSRFSRTNDVRFNTFFRINPAAGDTALVNKFYASSRGEKIVDVKVMRVAEMYLIRAEARAETNDLVGAASDINTLRAVRITGYTNVSFATREAAVAEIIDERAKELCFEGFRFSDLQRRQLPVARLASDVQSTQWQNLPSADYRFILPIPNQSIISNSNMKQNPGYN